MCRKCIAGKCWSEVRFPMQVALHVLRAPNLSVPSEKMTTLSWSVDKEDPLLLFSVFKPLSLITIQETILSFTTSDPPNPTSKNCSKLYWHISCEISTKQRASLAFSLNSPATTQDVSRARHSRNQSHTLRLSRAWDYWWECSKEWRSDRGNVEAVQTDLPFIVSKMSASKFHGAKAWRKAR